MLDATLRYLLIILIISFPCLLSSGELPEKIHPKQELRGVWMTTYANLDWPSSKNLTPEEQRAEFLQFLDQFEKVGINALFVQIRPSADAFYPSKFAPWSEFLSGKQGRAPEPYYDPLAFMVEACHERLIEFHAWLNPFRSVCNTKFSDISDEHISVTRPDWNFDYGTVKYLNPGVPEARAHVVNVISELIENYDLDGIHFDDYFYPYSISGQTIDDTDQYELFKYEGESKADWRRRNINICIKDVYSSIKTQKKEVKFGVGPFAIWRNKSKDSLGSETSVGQTSFDNLHCDVKRWMEEGWLDYVAPQMYWDFKHKAANYVKLMDWWTTQNFDRHLYIGHAIYKHGNIWSSKDELNNQIEYSRIQKATDGEMFYRAESFKINQEQIIDELVEGSLKYISVPPTMPWLDSIAPSAPRGLTISTAEGKSKLSWISTDKSSSYFLIYAIDGDDYSIENPRNIIGKTAKNYLEVEAGLIADKIIIVNALDRMHNESERK